MLAMLRTLLEERFRLEVELEAREIDTDLLVLADRNGGNGPGLRAVTVDCETNRLMEGSGPGLFSPESRIACGMVMLPPRATACRRPHLVQVFSNYNGEVGRRLVQSASKSHS